MNLVMPDRVPRRAEWIALIAIVLMAIIFRFQQFGEVPPGLHYDEAIDAKLAQDVHSGVWKIYFEEGWGREPLYHTLVAFALNFVPDPASALRLVSGLLGLIQLLAAYFLFKELFGVPTALIGAGWIAVMFWTVATSRAGLRNITLTTLATLTALAFWKTVVSSQWSAASGQSLRNPRSLLTDYRPLLTGLLLGLTLYTYQPSRVVPLIYMVFVGYLTLVDTPLMQKRLKAITIFFIVGAIIFVPMANYLATHPGAETSRDFQTEPIRALLKGDPSQVIETAVATLKMFTFEGAGDPQPIYNVPGRPLFIGLGSILFYLGLLVCLIRWRRPAYAFILIWLIVTLLPNMITAPAPFFYRAIAAQTPTLVLPAIGTVALGELFNRRREARRERQEENEALPGSAGKRAHVMLSEAKHLGVETLRFAQGDNNPARSGRVEKESVSLRPLRSWRFVVVVGVAVITLGQTALATQHDYFEVWGRNSEVRFQYSASHTAIAHALDASGDATPVAVSGLFIEDADPYIFAQTLRRTDVPIRWFDARSALVAIVDATSQRLAIPMFAPLDTALQSRFLSRAALIEQNTDFSLYAFDAAAFRADIARWGGHVQTPDRRPVALPISFDGKVMLLGHERPASVSRVEATLTLFTAWRVTSEWQPSSTAIFAHLLDGDGNLIAQDDQLGYPRHTWHAGDEFVQVHHIPLENVPPGRYTLQIGIYTRADDVRWIGRDASGNTMGDRVLLDSIEVQP